VNFPDLSEPVYNLLTAYLRENVVDYGDKSPPVDVLEITETLKLWLKARDPK
jgi:hypothetical protein